MNNPAAPPMDNFYKSACLFEASLVIVAVILGWMIDIDPFATLAFSESAILYGVLGTLPLLLLFIVLQKAAIKSLQEIRTVLMETLVSRLVSLHWADLCILSAIAGFAEEVLFRGVLQPWFEKLWGTTPGLWVSGLVFGLVHAITPVYALLAVLVSVYLGLSLDYGGSRNLSIPIIIHGLYDFLAFLLLVKQYKGSNR